MKGDLVDAMAEAVVRSKLGTMPVRSAIRNAAAPGGAQSPQAVAPVAAPARLRLEGRGWLASRKPRGPHPLGRLRSA
jgi:hypothetical protein